MDRDIVYTNSPGFGHMTIPGVVRGVNDGRTKASFFLQKTWEEKVSHKLKRVKWYWETDIHDK